MTEWQILTRVELPLALPLLVGGLRSATLQVVATATIAAYVAQGGLGRYLIEGIQSRDYTRAVVGAILVAALALLFDGLFAVVQKLVVPRGVSRDATRTKRSTGSTATDRPATMPPGHPSRKDNRMFSRTTKRVGVSVLALGLTVALASCASGDPLGEETGGAGTGNSITIGNQNFGESEILAQIYGQVLAANGYDVSYEAGIGSRETFILALQDGSIDLIPDYAGNALIYANPDATETSAADVEAALARRLSNRSDSRSPPRRRVKTRTRSSSPRSTPTRTT